MLCLYRCIAGDACITNRTVVRFNLFQQPDVLAYDFEGCKMIAVNPLHVKHCLTVAEPA